MSVLIIDGVQSQLPVPPEALFSELLDRLRVRAQASRKVLARIAVNGIDIDERDAIDLASLPVSEIDLIDVECRSARELAHDTLISLESYADRLSEMGRACTSASAFRSLVDGIEIFVESIQQVREILNAGPIDEADEHEHQLAALLQRIFDSLGPDGSPTDRELLTRNFPAHLEGWKNSAIPAIRQHFST